MSEEELDSAAVIEIDTSGIERQREWLLKIMYDWYR